MPEQLLKNFSIEIEQKLYEKETPQGNIAVYQTSPFGMMLTLNNQVVISESDGFFYFEMMSHPALFTHSKPEKVAIIGNTFGILQEVLKHPNVIDICCVDNNIYLKDAVAQYFSHQHQQDARIKYHSLPTSQWLSQCEPNTYDVIIQIEQPDDYLEENFKNYFRILKNEGILVQPCRTSFLHPKSLKPIYQNIQHAGFSDWQILNFPQPSYPSGWRTAMMATKRPTFNHVREKAIFNRPFTTRYYNFDVHKAALVMPEFMRKELEDDVLTQ